MHTATIKLENIEEKGSGGDKRVQSFVEGYTYSYKHSKKLHTEQYSKIK